MSAWNILLVDTSASMSSNKEEVNKGIIDLFTEQKNNTDRFTFLTFNTNFEIIADSGFDEINCEFILNSILNRGLTSLYDSIGYVYEMIIKETVVNITLTIITDGYENSSKVHTLSTLKKLRETIDKKCNFKVSFVCENKNVLDNNSAIISHANESFEVSGDYVEAFRAVSRTMSNVRYPSINDNQYNEEEIISFAEPMIKRQTSYSKKKRPCLFH
jgi:Mg-chelatase subunit ChlD